MDDIKQIIDAIGKTLTFKKNSFLFHAQDKATGLFYVISGEISIFKMDEQGHEVEVTRLGAHEFLGEAIIFVSSKFPVFARAVSDSKVVFIPKEEIDITIKKNPDFAKYFIKLLAQKCVILNKRIESLGLFSVRQRLLHFLATQCSGMNNCQFHLKMTKKELAKSLGTISETLSRNLKNLQEEELIEVNGSLITIKDCCRLRSSL